MHKAWLVIQREYIERIRSKAFIIMTMLMPVFMASTILIPALLSNMRSSVTRRIVLVANNGTYLNDEVHQEPTTGKLPMRSNSNSSRPQSPPTLNTGLRRNLRLPASRSKSAPTLLMPSATNCGMMSQMARLTAFSG